MKLLGAIIGAAIGAAIGGVIWALIAYAAHVEIGWIAWGVGLLAGGGAAIGARGDADFASGTFAALFAVVSILVAKYAVIHLLVKKEIGQIQNEFQTAGLPAVEEEEFWIVQVADQLIAAKEAQGQSIAWPAGVNPEEAEHEAEYPREIWSDAKARWGAMQSQARIDYRDQAQKYYGQQMASAMTALQSDVTGRGFFESFGAMDLLFGALAIITAFKVGSSDLPGMEKV